MSNTSLSDQSFSLVSGPSLRVDRSCRGPHLPSPQTTCLSLGLLACNLRQSSRSEVERVWLYVFDFESCLSQCFAPWAAWVPQSCNSLRSSAARDGAIQKRDGFSLEHRSKSVIFYVLCLALTYCSRHEDITTLHVFTTTGAIILCKCTF